MKNNLNPIGVFDSGLGGLTLLSEIKNQFPNESFIYFGDTAHLPYGSKSKLTIQLYSKKIVEFLIDQNVKLIIIACNTVSSLASKYLKENYDIPIIEVITPCVSSALKYTKNKNIGVIGTTATINSNIYSNLIHNINKHVIVTEIACPLLVPIIEEGWHIKKVSDIILDEYLCNLVKIEIDTLILGCTHYSIMENSILAYFNKKIKLITSANSICPMLIKILNKNNLHSNQKKTSDEFFVTDLSQNFKDQAQILLGFELINIKLIKPL